MALSFLERIKKKFLHLRLQPIRVFCFHQVSEVFDANTMFKCDHMSYEQFKSKILTLRKQYTFISLTDAYNYISNDKIRTKKYAVLTMDDAGNCILQLMPWLVELHIPITLFIPPAFVLGEVSNHRCGCSLTLAELKHLLNNYPSYITLGNHSYDHVMVKGNSLESFHESVISAESFLSQFPQSVPFVAYPGGYHTSKSDELLLSMHKVPVYLDAMRNYNDGHVIHRELL